MILAHLIVGMFCGTIAAIVVWHLGNGFWIMLATYSLVGSAGTTVSALIGPSLAWLSKCFSYQKQRGPQAHDMVVGEAKS
jgi:hypothetical protein